MAKEVHLIVTSETLAEIIGYCPSMSLLCATCSLPASAILPTNDFTFLVVVYPDLSLLIGGTINLKQISSQWDEVLRLLLD